jgi:hypothetical protein
MTTTEFDILLCSMELRSARNVFIRRPHWRMMNNGRVAGCPENRPRNLGGFFGGAAEMSTVSTRIVLPA